MTLNEEQSRRSPFRPGTLFLVFDLAGTFVFAVEGALAAVQYHLDLFGIVVLALTTASGGGVIRDLLLGSTPPAAFQDRRYAGSALIGAFTVMILFRAVEDVPFWLLVTLDAAGLSLFAVSGAAKALDMGFDGFIAAIMGVITGVGGGTFRDIFLSRIPGILRVDIYALAALVGATLMVLGSKRWNRSAMMFLGGAACFGLRMVSYWNHWNLPQVTPR